MELKIIELENGRKAIVVSETGEVILDAFLDIDLSTVEAIKIITKQEKEFLETKKEELDKNRVDMKKHIKNFGKLNTDCEYKLAKSDLTASELKICLFMRSKITFRNGKVRKDKKRLLKISDLPAILGITRKTVDKSVKTLIKRKIIIVNDGIIYFNPHLMYKGSYVEKELFDMFGENEWSD